jgi:hypothetical protein
MVIGPILRKPYATNLIDLHYESTTPFYGSSFHILGIT